MSEMEAISLGMLKTTGAVDLDKIDSLTVDEKMNEQTEAIIIGRMKPEHLNELQKKNIIGQILAVGCLPDIQRYFVFRGFIQAITIEESAGRVKILCKGAECLIHKEKKSCSLIQNETMNQIVLSGNDIISYAEKYRMIPLRRFKKVESKERMRDPVFESIENNLQLMGPVSPGYSDVLQQYAAAAVPVCTYPGNPHVENGIGIYAGRSM